MGEASTLYPFSAIVGQEQMKRALCLNAVHPGIGGVLISGERGTAKTTAVRALAGLLADSRVVELPLNATEDRVVGTLRIDELMATGERVLVPGVLSEADGNILYIDEVNLLEDHIVDLILDAAATGVCRIEREGVSEEMPARFVLVGTMNPEEGTLRPQLLDRFGLSVKVDGTLDRAARLELVRRQVEFEADPAAFRARFEADERALAQRIADAAARYPEVRYPAGVAAFAAGLCETIGVEGFRADIVIMKTARAAAAFEGRSAVTRDDVVEAARLALPHRTKHLPFDEGGLTEAELMRAVEAQGDCDEGAPSAEADQGTAEMPMADPGAFVSLVAADEIGESDDADAQDALKKAQG